MEKPDRKKFRRELGPRYAAKYAAAMRKYRKSMKTKTDSKPAGKVSGIGPVKDGDTYARKIKNSKTKPTGIGPVKSGATYARSLTKGKGSSTPKSALNKPKKSKPAASKPKPTKGQTERFFSSSSKGSVNKQQGKSNFFRSSSGTRGSNVPSNPKLKIQPKKKPKKNRRGRTVKRQDDYRLF